MRKAPPLRAGTELSSLPPGGQLFLLYCFLLFLFSPFIFFLFSPLLPALLLLSLHSPRRLWPFWQPTDERSWVYSPLHYSAQLHSVSDEESDTVSVQETCAGCPVGRGRSLRSLCKLTLQRELLWPLHSAGLLHGCGRALLHLVSALWQQARSPVLAETRSAQQGLWLVPNCLVQ